MPRYAVGSASYVPAPPTTHPEWCDPTWCHTRFDGDTGKRTVIHTATLLDEWDVWVVLQRREVDHHAELLVAGAEDAPPDQAERITAAVARGAALLTAPRPANTGRLQLARSAG